MFRPPELPWLKELHSRIWNCEDRLPLFRKVVVTQAHYDELQRSLNEKFLRRGLASYDGSKHAGILTAKLEFLTSTNQIESLSSRHPDNNMDQVDDNDDPEATNEGDDLEAANEDDDPEATNEDDCKIDSFFPFTLNYLDLSTLELKHESDCFPSPLFVRQEYDHISKLINKRPRDGKGSVIITGQPGTGEVLVSLSCRI